MPSAAICSSDRADRHDASGGDGFLGRHFERVGAGDLERRAELREHALDRRPFVGYGPGPATRSMMCDSTSRDASSASAAGRKVRSERSRMKR
jgi:hypothetical protein